MNYLPNRNQIKRKPVVKHLTAILVIQSFFLCSCVKELPYSEDVLSTLDMARANKKELISVLEHYSQNEKDSLKFKAACYLIANMKNHYSENKIKVVPAIVKSAFNYLDSLTKATYYSDKCLTSFEFVDTLHKVLYSLEYIPSHEFIDSIIDVGRAKVCGSVVVDYDRTSNFEKQIS